MDLYFSVTIILVFIAALFHQSRVAYRKGREDGTNEAIDLVLMILIQQGIITMNEAEDITRNDSQIK